MNEDNKKLIKKRTHCPVCNSSSMNTLLSIERDSKSFLTFLKIERFYSKQFWEAYHNGIFNGSFFKIVKCNDCGFAFQREVLDETGMKLLYNDWLDQELLLQYYREKKTAGYQENVLALLKKTFESQNGIQILDYGAGYGGFCALARKYGYNTFAYEFSDDKDNYLSSEIGVHTINNLDKYQAFFNFIHLNQVLEHVINPRQLLIQLSNCLQNKGILYVSVPNCRNIVATIKNYGLSKELFGLLSPHQHINAFNNKTLKKIGELAGLKAIGLIGVSKLIHKELTSREMIFLFKTLIKSFYGTSLFFIKVD